DAVKYVYCFGTAGTNAAKLQMLAPHTVAISPDQKSLYIADDGYLFKFMKNPVLRGIGRVTKATLTAAETVETNLTIK
ncbi:MAG: hypothetical protein ABI443_06990, partial [Chthoniobacterales bacterium]